MIIATALATVFQGLTIPYNSSNRTVQYGYGDQKELLKWIKSMGNSQKYPLIWYILNDFTELNGKYETEATLIIMQNTESAWFNKTRQIESYTKIINPLTNLVKNRLTENLHVEIVSRELKDRFKEKDEPNYGVDTNNENLTTSDFKGKKTYSDVNIVTDIVDARVIKFSLRINAECLIN
jgi:hypothetical protein